MVSSEKYESAFDWQETNGKCGCLIGQIWGFIDIGSWVLTRHALLIEAKAMTRVGVRLDNLLDQEDRHISC